MLPLLLLVRDFDGSPDIAHDHSRGLFLGGNRADFFLVLHKGNPRTTRHKTHFLEAREAAKDRRERFDVVALGQVLNEENLVGWQELV